MLWIPFVGLWGLYLAFLVLDRQRHKRHRQRSASHRALFIQIMAKVENSVVILNRMKNLAEHIREEALLDSYENCIEIQRQMLVALIKTPHFGHDPQAIRSSFFFAEGLEKQVQKTFGKFRGSIERQGQEVKSGQLAARGCYFCSRPFLVDRFKVVNTKINGLTVKVSTCPWCLEEIKSTGSMRVLYFQAGAERVHWSKVPSYDPSGDFWRLYDDLFLKQQKLKVVYTRGDEFDSPPR